MAPSIIGTQPYKPSGKYEFPGLLILPAVVALAALVGGTLSMKMLRFTMELPARSFAAKSIGPLSLCLGIAPALAAILAISRYKMRSPGLNCCLAVLSLVLVFLAASPHWLDTIRDLGPRNAPPDQLYNLSIVERSLPWMVLFYGAVYVVVTMTAAWFRSVEPFSEFSNRWLPRVGLSKVVSFPTRDAMKEAVNNGIDIKYLLTAKPLAAKRGGRFSASIVLWPNEKARAGWCIGLVIRERPQFSIGAKIWRVKPHHIGYADAIAIRERFGPPRKKAWWQRDGTGNVFARYE